MSVESGYSVLVRLCFCPLHACWTGVGDYSHCVITGATGCDSARVKVDILRKWVQWKGTVDL